MVFEGYATIAFQKAKIKPELDDHHSIDRSIDLFVEKYRFGYGMQDSERLVVEFHVDARPLLLSERLHAYVQYLSLIHI